MTSVDFPILIVGSAQRHSLENMYQRAFLANGISKVNLLDIESGKPFMLRSKVFNRLFPSIGHAWAERRLLTYLRNCSGYQWIIIFKGVQLRRQALEQCRRLTPSALWININPDDPYNLTSRGASNINVIKSITFYDVYCIWSHIIADRLRIDGCKRVLYLPFGYDETFHVPQAASNLVSESLVSFIGTWDREREGVFKYLAEFNVLINGPNWDRVTGDFPLRNSLSNLCIFGVQMSSIVSSSAICLNILRPQNRTSHNMRTFEIPAMGGLMLTNRTEEQQRLFPEDEACYMFEGIDELKAKILYILANKTDADRVRARGMELVRDHSYTKRALYLLKELYEHG